MRLTLLAGVLLLLIACKTEPPHPNIVYILADDMGYGDVSGLNSGAKISTPHLDRMILGGMHFTDAHSGSAVCTPTRYGILTGRYAWRTSLQTGVTWSWDPPLIDRRRSTVASFLKRHQYQTSCVGKWHLGLGWEKDPDGRALITKPLKEGPMDLGFDHFFGITASLDIPPYIYIENDRSTTRQIDSIEGRSGQEFWRPGQIGDDFQHIEVLPRLTSEALGFLDDAASNEHPFFLYFPLPAPHTPILPTEKFAGTTNTNLYGDFVTMVDDVVGQIYDRLEQNEQLENTLLIFTCDNGTSPRCDFELLDSLGHQPSYHFRGHKADIYEGGHRVPFLVHWPKRIAAGSSCDTTICHTDLLATLADITGDTLAEHEGEDSFSMLPLFLEDVAPARAPVINHSINGSFAVRDGAWKLAFCAGSGGWSYPTPAQVDTMQIPGLQLYNLETDPAEEVNLMVKEPDQVKRMTSLISQIISNGRSTPGEPQENDIAVQLIKP